MTSIDSKSWGVLNSLGCGVAISQGVTIWIHAGANVTTNNRGTHGPRDALDQLLVLFGRVST